MEWTEEHPTKPGIYWVSVKPTGRNPAPWVELPPVFEIMITPTGDVYELTFEKDEPTYNTDNMPDSVHSGVKYADAKGPMPSDPWSK